MAEPHMKIFMWLFFMSAVFGILSLPLPGSAKDSCGEANILNLQVLLERYLQRLPEVELTRT